MGMDILLLTMLHECCIQCYIMCSGPKLSLWVKSWVVLFVLVLIVFYRVWGIIFLSLIYLCIDLSCTPMNSGTWSRSGWTKIPKKHENVHPNCSGSFVHTHWSGIQERSIVCRSSFCFTWSVIWYPQNKPILKCNHLNESSVVLFPCCTKWF